jgi:hypothetical protein
MKDSINEVNKHVKNNKGSREYVSRKLQIQNNVTLINDNVKRCDYLGEQYPAIKLNISFFQHHEFKKKYIPENVLHKNIETLATITGSIFMAKCRYYPAYTIDAISKFNEFQTANEVKKQLQEKGIYSHIITFTDKNNYLLCVPAINVSEYANKIVAGVKSQVKT